MHWDKSSPKELLEWKDEYEKAQLKRQGWVAASGHSLSVALLQSTLILMQLVWVPCLHTTQRSETDRCTRGSRLGCLTHAPPIPSCMQRLNSLCSLLSCLANIFPLTRQCTYYPALVTSWCDISVCAQIDSYSGLPLLAVSVQWMGLAEWEQVISCCRPVKLFLQESWPYCSTADYNSPRAARSEN